MFKTSITDGKVLEECKIYFQSNAKLEENEEDDFNCNNPELMNQPRQCLPQPFKLSQDDQIKQYNEF